MGPFARLLCILTLIPIDNIGLLSKFSLERNIHLQPFSTFISNSLMLPYFIWLAMI